MAARSRDFIASEAAGGIVLMVASALALIVANSPLAGVYFHALHAQAGPLSVHAWINDALMAIFFLLVGLEIKSEFAGGRLATREQRRLPVIAAAAGMAVPAAIYLALTAANPDLSRGWAIAAATDIAFAMGLLALLGRHAPPSLKLLLTTIAIVDDLGAVAIIALAYTAKLNLTLLVGAMLVLGWMQVCKRLGVQRLSVYLALAVVLWVFVYGSGVHATVAGVAAAMTIPARAGERLEHILNPWVAFAIVPLFGFANAGVAFAGLSPAILLAPLPLAILLGLFAGKQIGIFASIWLAVRTRIAPRPEASWAQLYGMSLLAGIGFTMSLFIGGLAFPTHPELVDQVKIGVLAGSLLSALAGFAVLRLARGNSPTI
ncbi:MAG: Na+/H+ antiporter NhaA [Sphingomonadales bacterium]|nr:MAG: Na+/H+ antiporter NhaA [Sphingomonadales bacterium]